MSRVLVVDDDALTLQVLRYGLERDGYAVDTAQDGNEALESFSRHQQPVIVTDILMPERDGLALTFAIKRTHPKTQVIAITGAEKIDSPDYYRRMVKDAGACRVLAKPVDLSELRKTIRQALGRH